MSKPTVTEILPHVKDLYDVNPVGCCLHIVLDDGNVDDGSVDFCIAWAAKEKKHLQCFLLAVALRLMSKTQRKKLYNWEGKF